MVYWPPFHMERRRRPRARIARVVAVAGVGGVAGGVALARPSTSRASSASEAAAEPAAEPAVAPSRHRHRRPAEAEDPAEEAAAAPVARRRSQRNRYHLLRRSPPRRGRCRRGWRRRMTRIRWTAEGTGYARRGDSPAFTDDEEDARENLNLKQDSPTLAQKIRLLVSYRPLELEESQSQSPRWTRGRPVGCAARVDWRSRVQP